MAGMLVNVGGRGFTRGDAEKDRNKWYKVHKSNS